MLHYDAPCDVRWDNFQNAFKGWWGIKSKTYIHAGAHSWSMLFNIDAEKLSIQSSLGQKTRFTGQKKKKKLKSL